MERLKGKLLPLLGDLVKMDIAHARFDASFKHSLTFDARPFGSYSFATGRGDGYDVLVDGNPDERFLLASDQAQ